MNESNVVELKAPAEDALGELLKEGARQLLAQAIEAEVAELLIQYADQTVNGKRAVVRNGYLPERSIQTGLGEVPVKVPKVRDRSGGGIKFNSKLVPPYLKRTKNVEEFIPWLYLKGISTGEMQPALEALLGEGATGLSAATVSRLKKSWEADYRQWRQRDLSRRRYVYVWADGVYSNVRMDDRLCLLVIVGSDDTGRKEVLAVVDGYRESEASWLEVIEQLESQLAGGIVDEHDQGATWPASLKPVMWRAIDLHQFSRAGPAGAPLVNPGCFALLGLPQTLGDHPLSQRLDRQPVTVLLHQLLTGQRGAKVGVALMDQPHDLLPHGFGEGIARTPSQVPGNQPWRPFLAKADHQTLDLAYAQPKLHRGLPLP